METLRFFIGGIHLAVQSDVPLGADERWQRFLDASDAAADRTYRICHRRTLTLPQGDVNDCGSGKLLVQTGDALYRCYRSVTDGGLYAVVHEDGGDCHIDADATREPWGTMVQHFFEQLALQHTLVQRGRLLLHGAYICHDGQAIVFTAPSGTGKTTQVLLWQRLRGAQIINGDRVVLGALDGCATAYGVPMSGSSDDCRNVMLPLRAVVSLQQAPQNRVSALNGCQAVQCLVSGAYLPPEFAGDLPATMDAAIALAQRCSVLQLACRPDEGAVQALENYFISNGV